MESIESVKPILLRIVPEAEASIDARQTRVWLRESLADLPVHYGQILMPRYGGDSVVPYKEVAAVLGILPGTACSREAYAIKAIRKILPQPCPV
jgi:DNA-directed RNA polymerase specialized sigma24 family protein